jgi:DNA invertase Pin-like site-specific DNA recombinase
MPQIKQIRHETPQTGPLRVAAYCRVSSDSEDQLHSYANQIRYYTEYIGQHPDWELVDIYADEGLTGTKTEKREELKRLISDCRKGKIDRLFVKTVARFARNTYDCLQTARLLKSYGVTIYFEEQELDTAEMNDEMFLAMNGMQAQEESVTISNNMRWSYKERMEKGELFGAAAYGYQLKERTLEVYEPEAVIVRRIFDMYLSGMGKRAIAEALNAEGVPRRYKWDKWYTETVSYILKNERYIGDALLQKYYTTDFPFRMVKNKGERPQYYIDNGHSPIISRETYETVQRLFASRRRNEYSVSQYPLTGKMYCQCGSLFRRRVTRGIVYWECREHNKSSDHCPVLPIPESKIDEAFTLLVNKLIANREYILTPLIGQFERMQSRNSVTKSKVCEIDRQIAGFNHQIHSLAKHLAKGILENADYIAQSSYFNKKIGELRIERTRLLAEDENDEMIDELHGLSNIISLTDLQTAFDERIFDEIVTSVTAVSGTELRFRLVGGLELTEIITRTERRAIV